MDCLVTFPNHEGHQVRCSVQRLARQGVVFQVLDPQLELRTSAVLDPFTVVVGYQTAFSGKAVVSSLVDAGNVTVCEVLLPEPGLCLPELAAKGSPPDVRGAYREFLDSWQKHYRVQTEFKTIVTDLHSYLSDLRLWANQLVLRFEARPGSPDGTLPNGVVGELGEPVVDTIDRLHDRFEEVSYGIDVEARPVHRILARQLLTPFFLCTPFGHRSFQKPLGYAGDFEMMNMIHRNAPEGPDLFSQLVHYWLVQQWPAESVRNRVAYIKSRLVEVAARAQRKGRPARILSLGCGPAREAEEFIRESALANDTELTLLDFDEEPLAFARDALTEAAHRSGYHPAVRTQRLSAQKLLRLAATDQRVDSKDYDLIYCAGLFDYLSDAVCRQLVSVFYDWLAADGRLVVSNMDDTKPFRNMLEFLLDWHLIYRRGPALLEFRPSQAPADHCRVCSEATSVNHFLEIDKPPLPVSP